MGVYHVRLVQRYAATGSTFSHLRATLDRIGLDHAMLDILVDAKARLAPAFCVCALTGVFLVKLGSVRNRRLYLNSLLGLFELIVSHHAECPSGRVET